MSSDTRRFLASIPQRRRLSGAPRCCPELAALAPSLLFVTSLVFVSFDLLPRSRSRVFIYGSACLPATGTPAPRGAQAVAVISVRVSSAPMAVRTVGAQRVFVDD